MYKHPVHPLIDISYGPLDMSPIMRVPVFDT